MQQVTRFVDPTDSELSSSQGVAKIESLSDRDAGFCSGEETDLDTEYHSPTDASRDSLDSKENSVDSYRSNKNKRKCVEPRRVGDDTKRRILDISSSINSITNFDTSQTDSQSNPFRPWSVDQQLVNPQISGYTATYQLPLPSGYDPQGHEEVDASIQEEPLSLVVKKKQYSQPSTSIVKIEYHSRNLYQPCRTATPDNVSFSPVQEPRPQDVVRINNSRTKSQIGIKGRNINIKSKPSHDTSTIKNSGFSSSICSSSSQEEKKSSLQLGNNAQRNYKNMTRERRIEANARERTRVHTISAAFDTLRRSVPAYASDQKLSKLSVLRIACSYIMTLSRIAGHDYSEDHTQPSIADCVDNVCSTIQLEGKTRKKKDE